MKGGSEGRNEMGKRGNDGDREGGDEGGREGGWSKGAREGGSDRGRGGRNIYSNTTPFPCKVMNG